MSDVGAGNEIRDHCHAVAPRRSRRSLDLQAIHQGDKGSRNQLAQPRIRLTLPVSLSRPPRLAENG